MKLRSENHRRFPGDRNHGKQVTRFDWINKIDKTEDEKTRWEQTIAETKRGAGEEVNGER